MKNRARRCVQRSDVRDVTRVKCGREGVGAQRQRRDNRIVCMSGRPTGLCGVQETLGGEGHDARREATVGGVHHS